MKYRLDFLNKKGQVEFGCSDKGTIEELLKKYKTGSMVKITEEEEFDRAYNEGRKTNFVLYKKENRKWIEA